MRIFSLLLMMMSAQAFGLDNKIIEHLEKNEPTVVFSEPLAMNLDPISSGSMQANWINRLLYRSPFYISDDGKVRSNLLDYFYYDRKNNTISLELSNAEFSDGSKIEAIDLAYSILRVELLNKKYAIFDKIEGYEEWKRNDNKFNSLPVGVTVSEKKLTIQLTSELKKPFNDLWSLDFSIVPSAFINKDTAQLGDGAPTSGIFSLEIISQNLYRFVGKNEVINIASVQKDEILDVLPHIRENHTIQIEDITLPPEVLKTICNEYPSFANINKRIYGVVLDPTKAPFSDISVRKYFIKEHRKTVAELYGEDMIEGSLFSRVSPGFLSMNEIENYSLSSQQEDTIKKYLQENPPYFNVNLEKEGSKLVKATLSRLNVEPKVTTNGYASIRWFSTGFEVYDLINDLRDVFTPGRHKFLDAITKTNSFINIFQNLIEDKEFNEKHYIEFNHHLNNTKILAVITNHDFRYVTTKKSNVKRKEVLFSLIDLFRD